MKQTDKRDSITKEKNYNYNNYYMQQTREVIDAVYESVE